MAALDFEERFAVIRQAAPRGGRDFRAEPRSGGTSWFALRRASSNSEKEREHFRTVHRLVRQARVPSTESTILKIGLLACYL